MLACPTGKPLLGLLLVLLACSNPTPAPLTSSHRVALGDSVLALFDSLSAIHTGHPDSGLLRRLHPPADTLLFIEGGKVENLTGDSLFRRVLALHRPVSEMTQRFTERHAQLLDRNTAVLTATETVHWADTAGEHDYSGLLTLVVTRRQDSWVVRAYRG
jgi:SnoaL-like domain